MKAVLQWREGMMFDVESAGHVIQIDAKAPIGRGQAMTPKELVIAGLGGCTAMDVVALLKKHKQPFASLTVESNVVPTEGKAPVTFQSAEIEFKATGPIDAKVLVEAVHLSQTRYCGVSAMLAKAFPIRYKVVLNGEVVGEGQANFEGELT